MSDDPAWQQQEAPDDDAPSLVDRLYAMPADEVVRLVAQLMRDEPDVAELVEQGIEDYETADAA